MTARRSPLAARRSPFLPKPLAARRTGEAVGGYKGGDNDRRAHTHDSGDRPDRRALSSVHEGYRQEVGNDA
jgi:hypothetical protein